VTHPIGSVSCATMRPEDLIPAFVYELQTYRRRRQLKAGLGQELRAIERRMRRKGYYESEEADYDLEWLFDALDEYAGPYFYFGAHPGDGADYGYWLSESFEEDFDGLKVNDLADVPKAYRGEVLVVNDHGNMSLYAKSARKLTEIWSIV
jgi:hypothetical protein